MFKSQRVGNVKGIFLAVLLFIIIFVALKLFLLCWQCCHSGLRVEWHCTNSKNWRDELSAANKATLTNWPNQSKPKVERCREWRLNGNWHPERGELVANWWWTNDELNWTAEMQLAHCIRNRLMDRHVQYHCHPVHMTKVVFINMEAVVNRPRHHGKRLYHIHSSLLIWWFSWASILAEI